jgi:hypothetical protein
MAKKPWSKMNKKEKQAANASRVGLAVRTKKAYDRDKEGGRL